MSVNLQDKTVVLDTINKIVGIFNSSGNNITANDINNLKKYLNFLNANNINSIKLINLLQGIDRIDVLDRINLIKNTLLNEAPKQTNSKFSFGIMPNKDKYTTNTSFAIGRKWASRITPEIPKKQFKTQNINNGSGGRLLKLKRQSALGDATITKTNGVIIEPNFGGADRTIVNSHLSRVRNIGLSVPRRAIRRN
jgi:hypothetical protein